MDFAPWCTFLLLIFLTIQTEAGSRTKPNPVAPKNRHSNLEINILGGFIDEVNRTISSATFKWIKLSQFVLEQLKRLCTAKMSYGLPPKSDMGQNNVWDTFDWRKERPDCPSLFLITNQGACGSCWAISAAHVMSDRLCIHSKGVMKDYVSAYNLLSCNNNSEGCLGGDPAEAWRKYLYPGTINGSFTTERGCQPYIIEPCNPGILLSKIKQPCWPLILTPDCQRRCFGEDFEKPKQFKAKEIYQISETGDIMKEIKLNGPVQAFFKVFASFFGYISGVYCCPDYDTPQDQFLGNHVIRILGWGVENGVPFWLCSNSYGSEWGLNGYFKIKRGSGKTRHGEGECGIESYVLAGIPKLENENQ